MQGSGWVPGQSDNFHKQLDAIGQQLNDVEEALKKMPEKMLQQSKSNLVN